MSLMNKGSVEAWDIDRIIPYKRNAKVHSEQQVATLADLINRNGWTQPIVVQKSTGTIIAGHGRRLAAKHLGLTKVPVFAIDCTDEEARGMRLADNRVASTDYDATMVQAEIFDLAELGFDLSLLAMDDKELAFLGGDLGELNGDAFAEDISEAVEEQKKENSEKISGLDDGEISLSKGLGIKNITRGNARKLKSIISTAEKTTGKEGINALISFFDNHK